MTLSQLLDSWRTVPGFLVIYQTSRQELQRAPSIYLDRYLRVDGRTPPDSISARNTDVIITNYGLPNEEALVVTWR